MTKKKKKTYSRPFIPFIDGKVKIKFGVTFDNITLLSKFFRCII